MPQEVRAISLNLTPEVGANDSLIWIKVVPDSRDGSIVYGRSPLPQEKDLDLPIIFYPENGEELRFKPGSILFSIIDIDKHATKYEDGYSSITNTLWTWLIIGSPSNMVIFRLLLATARRLDAAHSLLIDILKRRDNIQGSFIFQRESAFDALALAEIFIITLSRSINLVYKIKGCAKSLTDLPLEVRKIKKTIEEMRNAFEHIDDRAFGRVKKNINFEATSIFEQHEFIPEGKLSYLHYKIDLIKEAPRLLVLIREYLFQVAVEFHGSIRICTQPISFFNNNKII